MWAPLSNPRESCLDNNQMGSSSVIEQVNEPPGVSRCLVRAATPADIPDITAIYGRFVATSTATFEVVPPDELEMLRRWRAVREHGLPYLVAERAGQVIGYCYAGPYRPRSGYRFTLEDSIYIDAAETGRGVGRLLLQPLIERCSDLGYRQMVAVIGGRETLASIRLHEALGFSHMGILPGIGFKFGRWIDTVLMQRALGDGSSTQPS